MPLIEKHSLHVYREIHEQPEVLERLLDRERSSVAGLAAEIKRRNVDHVVIAARGTSDNAARYAQYLLGACNRLPVGLAAPSLFSIYDAPPRFGNALVLGISQSGKSPDIVSVLAEARRQGALTAAVTNFPQSDLAEAADHVIALRRARSARWPRPRPTRRSWPRLPCSALRWQAIQAGGQCCGAFPRRCGRRWTCTRAWRRVAERYRYMTSCVTIGRGFNYSTAFELALKMKEMTYTVVEAYSSADFLHGPFALLAPGFPVFAIAPSGKMLPELRTFMGQVQDREAELVVISDDAGCAGCGPGPACAARGRPRVAFAAAGHRRRPALCDGTGRRPRPQPGPAAGPAESHRDPVGHRTPIKPSPLVTPDGADRQDFCSGVSCPLPSASYFPGCLGGSPVRRLGRAAKASDRLSVRASAGADDAGLALARRSPRRSRSALRRASARPGFLPRASPLGAAPSRRAARPSGGAGFVFGLAFVAGLSAFGAVCCLRLGRRLRFGRTLPATAEQSWPRSSFSP